MKSNTSIVSDKIQQLSNLIIAQQGDGSYSSQDGSVYLGYSYSQNTLQRDIWIDENLTDKDVRAWGLLRTQLTLDGSIKSSANQFIEQNLHYAKQTVINTLLSLRLTRWVSLCQPQQNIQGAFTNNIYAVHDAPVSLVDAMYLDTHYVSFVESMMVYPVPAIAKTAKKVWQFIQKELGDIHDHESGEWQVPDRVKKFIEENNGLTGQAAKNNEGRVYFLDPVDTCSSSLNNNLNKKTTTTSSGKIKTNFPSWLSENEITLAKMHVKRIPENMQQSFIDEMTGQKESRQHTKNPIRNPVGYLAWLCNEYAAERIRLTSAAANIAKQREKRSSETAKIKSFAEPPAKKAKLSAEERWKGLVFKIKGAAGSGGPRKTENSEILSNNCAVII